MHEINGDTPSDNQLVNRVIKGDIEAFGLLVDRYEAKLMRYVVYLIHDSAVAQDIVQEVFIKAYQNLQGFKSKYKFSSWIYRIAHNEAMNYIRKTRRLVYSDNMEELKETSSEDGIATEIDREILKKQVQGCLDQLDMKYREVLILQYYENMSYVEISDILHIPVSTVGVRSLRGRNKLRALCQKEGVSYEIG